MVDSTSEALPVQGWYSDPWGIEPLRWWDGHTWTACTAETGEGGAPAAGSDDNGVTIRKSAKPHFNRPVAKGWTPLKMVLATAFVLGGVFAILAGAATWHSVSSRPHVVAQVTSQFHCVSDPDTGPACDERIAFFEGGREIHTVVRSIDPGRDLMGEPGHQYLTVFYDPTHPSHVEGVDGVAFQGIVMILGGLASIVGVAIVGRQITRAGKKQTPGQSEIHGSILT
jgi:Protein of unknown function (DUF2510)